MKNKLHVWVRKCEPSQAAYHSTTCKSVYWTVKNQRTTICLPALFMSTEQANCVGIWPPARLVCLDLFVFLSVCVWRACVAPWSELMAASSRRAHRCWRLCPSRRRPRECALTWRWPPSAAPPPRRNPFPGCPRCAGLPKHSQIHWVIPVKIAPPCGSKLTSSYKLTVLHSPHSVLQLIQIANK